MLIGIIGWVVLGLIAGLIGSKFINLRGDDPRMGIALGGIGGFVGGWLYSLFSGTAVSAFNATSLMVAGIGAVVALVAWHGWRRTSAY